MRCRASAFVLFERASADRSLLRFQRPLVENGAVQCLPQTVGEPLFFADGPKFGQIVLVARGVFSLFGRKAGKSIRPGRRIRPSPCRPSGPRCSVGPYRSRFRRRHPCDCSGIRAAAPDDIRPGRACNGPFACRDRAFRSAPCSGRGRDSCPCGRPFVASG